MRAAVLLAIAIAVTSASTAAAAERTAKANRKVLDFVSGRIEDFYFDPAGPPGWPGEWEQRFEAMATITDACAFYEKLDDLLKQTGVSHFSVWPPEALGAARTRRALGRLKLARIGGSFFVRAADGELAEAGLRPGDELLEIAGRPAAEYLAAFPCGPAPSSMRLQVSSAEGKVSELELPDRDDPPATTADEPLVSRELDGGVHYLKLRSFGRSYDARAVGEALERAASAAALVIDLRGNPGGADAQMCDLLGRLYARDFTLGAFVNLRFGRYAAARARYLVNYLRARNLTAVTMFGRREIAVAASAAPYGGKLVVLVDPYTASAAEIAAWTLQRTGRATIVGERTAGAVLAVLTFNLPDGGRFAMPAATFVDAEGRPVEGKGVMPDVEAPPTRQDLASGRDGALQAALALLATSPEAAPAR